MALDYTIDLSYAPEGVTPIKPRQATERPDARAIIIHHPHGGLKRVDMYNSHFNYAGDLVVQYTANDAPGSSGSRVLNDDLDVIALHNRRGEGICLNALLDDLREYAPAEIYWHIVNSPRHHLKPLRRWGSPSQEGDQD